MYGFQGIEAYQRTSVVTADPGKLILMCYEGAIDHLKAAKNCYLSGEYEAKAASVQKALDIIHELTQGLDFAKGGEVARNLNALYAYMMRRITEGDIQKDCQAFDQVIRMLEELEDAWKEIIKR